MARIAGVNIPTNKPIGISLTYIYGVGRKSAVDICSAVGVDPTVRTNALSEADVIGLRGAIDREYTVEGDLRRQIAVNIKRLTDLGCYRGLRHRHNLPVRGQRTRTNARTRKSRPRRPFVRKG